MLSKTKWFRSKPRHKAQSLKAVPSIEMFERRQLMAAGFLQGTVFADSAGTPLQGATVTLTGPVGFTPETTTSDASGNYLFSNLASGTYTLTETAPNSYTASGTQALSDFYPVTGTTTSSVTVSVIDSTASPVTQTYVAPRPASKIPMYVNLNGNNDIGSYVGQADTYLSTSTPASQTAIFYPFCVDLNADIGPGDAPFSVTPAPLSTLPGSSSPALGQIGYLYNTYAAGQGLLSVPNSPALQLAIWELEYDPSDTGPYTNQLSSGQPSSGNFSVDAAGSVGLGGNSAATINSIIAQAYVYLNASIGKNEPALFLNAIGDAGNSQSFLAGESFNFNNTKKTGPDAISVVSGTVFADGNNNNLQDNGELGIPNVTVSLTGTDITGTAVNLSTTTNSSGAYSFTGLVASNSSGYTVTETPPSGYIHESQIVGSTGGTTGTDTITTVLPADTTSSANNFSEILPGSIAGTVYTDITDNGLTNDDTPLSGVTVTLYNSTGTTVLATTTSASNGTYSFTGLIPGTYVVKETVPGGYTQTAPASVSYTDTLTVGQNVTSQNFDNFLPASISGTVYTDITDNGLTNDDTPLSGVTVTLYNSTGTTALATTTSASNGTYSFTGLIPGTYVVKETVPGGYTQTAPASVSYTDTLTAGQNVTSQNFDNFLPASISGTVFTDITGNGLTNDDTPLGGVTVNLYTSTGTFITSTVSNATTGTYSFTGLIPGSYKVTENVPTGDTETAPASTFYSVTTTNGSSSTGNNFDNVAPSIISGTVYTDITGNGLTNDDTPLSGVTVNLTTTSGTVVATTTSSSNGTFSFTGVAPGTYKVTEVVPTGDTLTAPSSTVYTVTATSGSSSTGNNFDNVAPSVISGVTYNDVTGNGLTSDDTPLGGVTVNLYTSGGTLITSTVSNATTGAYSFTGLPPGSYKVAEIVPTGYLQTAPSSTTYSVTTTSGSSSTNNNFDNVKSITISGTVYTDTTGNGLTSDDTPESGTTVYLFNSSLQVVQTAVTGANGTFSFTGVAPGSYYVNELVPTMYVQTAPNSQYYVDSSLVPGQNVTNQNFDNYDEECNIAGVKNICYTVTSATGTVTHPTTLFGNVTAGSTVSVSFTWAGTTNDNLALVAYTAPNGNFIVNGALNISNQQGQVIFGVTSVAVSPGNKTYTITQTVPTGYFQIDFICGPALSNLYTTLNDNYGAQNRYIDGAWGGSTPDTPNSAAISGTVYADNNNSGSLDTGDTGIAGDTVTLTGTDYLGNVVNVSTTTNASGQYSFTGLNPNEVSGYTITESAPSGYIAGTDTPGSTGGVAGTRTISGVKVNFSQTSSGNNFGEIKLGSISGTIYTDLTGNGLTSDDTPESGVTVYLYNGNVQVIATAVTASNGTYSFTNLTPGFYYVNEVTPAGYTKTAPGNPGYYADTLSGGQTITSQNFDNYLPTVISGTIYTDTTGNGLTSDDTPESGVTVDLYNGNVQVIATAVTGANGMYSFTVAPGFYYVNEVTPSGYTKTAPGNPGYYTATPSYGQTVANLNFDNYLNRGTITGTVYSDVTGNGLTSDDKSLGGVTVNLYNSGGTLVATTTSDVTTGVYVFSNVAPGTYTVTEITPNGDVETAPTSGSYTVSVTAGSTSSGNNFDNYMGCDSSGMYGLCFAISGPGICGTNWVTNLGGQVYQGDTITAYYYVSSSSKSPEMFTLVSYVAPDASFNASDAYEQTIYQSSSTSVNPGTYGSVTITVPNSYFQVDFVCGSAISQFGPAGSNIFYSAQNRLFSTANGGTQAPGVLAGYVYYDANGSGTFTSGSNGDAGIAGATVSLSGTTTTGTPVSATTTTASDGSFSFTGLVAGNYTLTETTPSGYLAGANDVGSAGGTAGAVGTNTVSSIPLTFAPGGYEDGFNYDFANLKPAVISGLIFADNNADGVEDCGETGLSGVTVKLTGTNASGQAVSLSTTTASNGTFSFSGLAPSNSSGYMLTETLPSGYTTTKNTVGTVNGSTDGSLSGSTAISNIKISGSQTGVNYDFAATNFTSSGSSCSIKNGDYANTNFWCNTWGGQQLINSLGSGSKDTKLASWLTSNFPSLYPTSLIGTTNSSVAAAFCKLNSNANTTLEADTMALALSCYVTNKNLAGTNGQSYGFNCTSTGSMCDTFNLGSQGTTYGLANNCNYTIQTILNYTNWMASNGSISGCSYKSSQWTAMDNACNSIQTSGGICW